MVKSRETPTVYNPAEDAPIEPITPRLTSEDVASTSAGTSTQGQAAPAHASKRASNQEADVNHPHPIKRRKLNARRPEPLQIPLSRSSASNTLLQYPTPSPSIATSPNFLPSTPFSASTSSDTNLDTPAPYTHSPNFVSIAHSTPEAHADQHMFEYRTPSPCFRSHYRSKCSDVDVDMDGHVEGEAQMPEPSLLMNASRSDEDVPMDRPSPIEHDPSPFPSPTKRNVQLPGCDEAFGPETLPGVNEILSAHPRPPIPQRLSCPGENPPSCSTSGQHSSLNRRPNPMSIHYILNDEGINRLAPIIPKIPPLKLDAPLDVLARVASLAPRAS